EVKLDLGTVQAVGFRDHATMFNAGGRTEGLQPGLVHIEGAGADGVATREGDPRTVAARGQRPKNGDGCAELADRIEVGVVIDLRRDVDDDGAAVELNVAAKPAKHVRHIRNVRDLRAVLQDGPAFGEHGGAHEFKHAVFRAADFHCALQPGASIHHKTVVHNSQGYALKPSVAVDRRPAWCGRDIKQDSGGPA